MDQAAWPALPYAEWAPTKKTLQMCAQMLGKVRLALRRRSPSGCTRACISMRSGFTTGSDAVRRRPRIDGHRCVRRVAVDPDQRR